MARPAPNQRRIEAAEARLAEAEARLVETERRLRLAREALAKSKVVQALGHLRGLTEAQRAARKPDGHVP